MNNTWKNFSRGIRFWSSISFGTRHLHSDSSCVTNITVTSFLRRQDSIGESTSEPYMATAPDRQKNRRLSKYKFQLSLNVLFICDSLNVDILFNQMRIMVGFSIRLRRWSAFSVSYIVLDARSCTWSSRMLQRIMRDLCLCTSIFKTVFSEVLASNRIAYKSGAKMNELESCFSVVEYWNFSVWYALLTLDV